MKNAGLTSFGHCTKCPINRTSDFLVKSTQVEAISDQLRKKREYQEFLGVLESESQMSWLIQCVLEIVDVIGHCPINRTADFSKMMPSWLFLRKK